jgi:hypothetical protein
MNRQTAHPSPNPLSFSYLTTKKIRHISKTIKRDSNKLSSSQTGFFKNRFIFTKLVRDELRALSAELVNVGGLGDGIKNYGDHYSGSIPSNIIYNKRQPHDYKIKAQVGG